MSAKGRGPKARKNNHYATPAWLTRALLRHLGEAPSLKTTVLDAGCGGGAIMAEVLSFWQGRRVVGVEMNPRLAKNARANLKRLGSVSWDGWEVLDRNFLDRAALSGEFDYAIFNPPFELSLPFLRRCIELSRTICMLGRLNWLESNPKSVYDHVVERKRFLDTHPPEVRWTDVRPSFTGDGSCDATAYAWMIWGDAAQPGTCGPLALDPDAWENRRVNKRIL